MEGIAAGTNGGVLGLHLARLGGEVHDRLEDLRAGDAVDRGVVDLASRTPPCRPRGR